jgi:hypothetical protein
MKDLEALNLNSWTQMIPDWKKYKQVAWTQSGKL